MGKKNVQLGLHEVWLFNKCVITKKCCYIEVYTYEATLFISHPIAEDVERVSRLGAYTADYVEGPGGGMKISCFPISKRF